MDKTISFYIWNVFLDRWMRCFCLLFSHQTPETVTSVVYCAWPKDWVLGCSTWKWYPKKSHFIGRFSFYSAAFFKHETSQTHICTDPHCQWQTCTFQQSFATSFPAAHVPEQLFPASRQRRSDRPPAPTLLIHVSLASVGGQVNGISLSASWCSHHVGSPSSVALRTVRRGRSVWRERRETFSITVFKVKANSDSHEAEVRNPEINPPILVHINCHPLHITSASSARC